MKWLITGGCGFIGVNLINELLIKGGHTIVVLDNLTGGTVQDLEEVCPVNQLGSDNTDAFGSLKSGEVGLVVGDILDDKLTVQAASGADVIVHLAANTGVQPSILNPRQDMESNVVGTFNLLEAARLHNTSRFVFASSGAPVGEVEPPIHEELAPHPVSPYGASKLAGEGYCSAYAKSFGVETVCLRFGNVYGPLSKRKSSVVAKFIRRALAGEVLEVYGDGKQTRDFIFVKDLVDAIFAAATRESVGGETFQIATQSETNLRELLEHMIAMFEEFELEKPEVRFTDPLVGDVLRNFSDTSKAKAMLGWQATTGLPEGLRATMRSFLDA